MQVFTARQCCSLAADIHSFSRLTCKISRVNENLYFVIFPTDIVDAITGNGKILVVTYCVTGLKD
jgi:hypothetical protein